MFLRGILAELSLLADDGHMLLFYLKQICDYIKPVDSLALSASLPSAEQASEYRNCQLNEFSSGVGHERVTLKYETQTQAHLLPQPP